MRQSVLCVLCVLLRLKYLLPKVMAQFVLGLSCSIVYSRAMRAPARLVALLVMVACLCLEFQSRAADDTLPNFNAPADNSPLNADKVNRVFGASVFTAGPLWDEDDASVAKRLGWPEESRTSTLSSFRLYPDEKTPVNLLRARAYSCVLYATKDRPTEVSIVFVNEGDYEWTQNFSKEAKQKSKGADAATADDDAADISRDVHDAFEKALKHDAQSLTDALTGLFGPPAHQGFGGGAETREQVKRWDWQGHAFLLSTPRDSYVTLRIVPVAFADNYGKADNIDHDDLKAMLLQRVKSSDSGDVLVTEIPMVDQGPKGYCVPATWERYMRFLGIPADMYVLAMAAGSSQEGTNLDAMVENVDSLVTLYRRRIDNFSGDLDMRTISKNIDKGLPLMWGCFIHIPLEKAITNRMDDRAKVTDWNAWAAQLAAGDSSEIAQEITGDQSAGGHQRMIVGYNNQTNEIAISDSWSKRFALRWMTLREANAINQGQFYVIEP
jgi:hypothetical protein